MDSYLTLDHPGMDEVTIQKSRFIGRAWPCSTEEEALARLRETRDAFRDARHHCYAYIIGENEGILRYSDDGEPGGTAGMPILSLLRSEKLVNCCVVVTRYFGGIKLGTGGLVRAYTSSAKLALEAAGIREVREMVELDVILEYTYLARVENMIREKGYDIEDTTYEDRVRMRISCLAEDAEYLKKQLAELTGGTFEIVSENEKNA